MKQLILFMGPYQDSGWIGVLIICIITFYSTSLNRISLTSYAHNLLFKSLHIQPSSRTSAFQTESSNVQKNCTSTIAYTEHLLISMSIFLFYPDQSHIHNKKNWATMKLQYILCQPLFTLFSLYLLCSAFIYSVQPLFTLFSLYLLCSAFIY